MAQPVVKVYGTPYEQGVQQGEALKSVIDYNVGILNKRIHMPGIRSQEYIDFTLRNAEFLQNKHPNLMDEIRGIADGSGHSQDEILFVNIPTYFLMSHFKEECSMLLCRGPATEDGKTYLIKNRDMGMHLEQALIERHFDNGTSVVCTEAAGTVTYPACGMNNSGLAIATTGFWSDKEPTAMDRIGEAHVFVNERTLLEECRTAKEALEALETYPRMNAINLIIADEKDAYIVEVGRDDMVVVPDDGSGVLYRTNHEMTPERMHLNMPRVDPSSTYCRYDRIGELVKESYGHIRFQDLYRIMSDHENGRYGICRHPDEETQAMTISTTLSVIEDRECWTTIWNPCESLRHTSLS